MCWSMLPWFTGDKTIHPIYIFILHQPREEDFRYQTIDPWANRSYITKPFTFRPWQNLSSVTKPFSHDPSVAKPFTTDQTIHQQ